MSFRTLFALMGALILAALLNGCGGGKSIKSGSVRLANLTAGALDLRISGTNIIANVAPGAVSGYVEREAGSSTFELGANGVATAALSLAGTVNNNVSYTIVAYTTEQATAAVFLSDNADEPAKGSAKFRLFNGANEAGALDVYITSANASLSGATPINSAVQGQQLGAYATLNPGTYRIRVTGSGSRTDVRLDIPAVTITDKQIATLVVNASASGMLVNGTLMNQGGTVTGYSNSTVRLSVVADLTGAAPVDVELGGQPLVTGLASPQATNYLLVGADLSTLKVNGAAVPATAPPISPGSDVTLLVIGAAAAPNISLTIDDNRPPSTSDKAMLRLGHGINGLTGAINVDQGAIFLARATAPGQYSAPIEVSAGTDITYRVQPAAGTCASAPWSKGPLSVTAGSVYTLFALGECAGTGALVLRQDR